ncbi:MAG: hypothetical protein H0U72_07050 [Nitrosospira sp.]|nr:hypothetical protein [Nitrosospira sp.]
MYTGAHLDRLTATQGSNAVGKRRSGIVIGDSGNYPKSVTFARNGRSQCSGIPSHVAIRLELAYRDLPRSQPGRNPRFTNTAWKSTGGEIVLEFENKEPRRKQRGIFAQNNAS